MILKRIIWFAIGVVMLSRPASVVHAQILDESCSVTVNGRTAQVRADGSFSITNVPVSVDLFRVTGVCQGTGVPLYIVGDEFFEMAASGQTIGSSVTLDTTAPPKVESISITAGVSTLTNPMESTQLEVVATYAGGGTADVTPRLEGTAYRTSNPAIATVSIDGSVMAVANGTALITVSNQGATAVLAITVSLGDPLTTIEGFVQLDDGTPVDGATVTTTLGGSTTSGPDGSFSISGLASLQGTIVVEAEALVGMTTLYGQSLEIEPTQGGLTDAGIVEIGNKVYWITNGSGNWGTGSNWHTGVAPQAGQVAIIDRPGMDIVVTHSSGTSTPAGIVCKEAILLSGGTLAPTGYSEIATLNLTTGTLGGTGQVVASGALNWSGGTMTGSGTTTVDFGATLSISGAATKTMSSGRTLRNEGTGTLTGTGTWFLQNGSTFVNAAGALFDVQSNSPIDNSSVPDGVVWNEGTFRKTVATGVTTIDTTVVFNNTGTLDAQSGSFTLNGGGTNTSLFSCSSGATIDVGADVYNFGTGADTAGPGFVRVTGGTLSVGAGISANAENLSLHNGGFISGTGELVVDGTFSWSGGTMSAAGITRIAPGGTLDISGAATKTMQSGRTLQNEGTGTFAGTGSWFLQNDSTFVNALGAVFEAQSDATIDNSSAPTGVVTNAGTYRKLLAVGESLVDTTVAFNNTGTLETQSGSISLNGGGTNSGLFSCAVGTSIDVGAGTYNFITGADTAGPGFVRVTGGTLSVGTGITANAENLALQSGGFISGTGELVVDGTFSWSGGTMSAAGTTRVASPGTLDISGAATKTMLSDRTLRNEGTGTLTGTGTWFLQNGSTFVNAAGALFDVQSNAAIDNASAPIGVISNAGTFQRSVATGIATIDTTVTFSNSGLVDVQSGTLRFDGGYTQSAGALNLNGGGVGSVATLAINGGTVSGDGAIAANVSNGGAVEPGVSPGIIDITGAYTQTSGGSLDIEIGGLTAGTDFDQLNSTGAAILAGTLNISVINGFEPMLGDSFVIMTFGSRSGTFTVANGTDTGNGLEFQVVPGTTSVVLNVVQP